VTVFVPVRGVRLREFVVAAAHGVLVDHAERYRGSTIQTAGKTGTAAGAVVLDVPFLDEQLAVEQRGARRAADRVVREAVVLHAGVRRLHAAGDDAHPARTYGAVGGLGALRLVLAEHLDELVGRAGERAAAPSNERIASRRSAGDGSSANSAKTFSR